jgi:hypothetical protein
MSPCRVIRLGLMTVVFLSLSSLVMVGLSSDAAFAAGPSCTVDGYFGSPTVDPMLQGACTGVSAIDSLSLSQSVTLHLDANTSGPDAGTAASVTLYAYGAIGTCGGFAPAIPSCVSEGGTWTNDGTGNLTFSVEGSPLFASPLDYPPTVDLTGGPYGATYDVATDECTARPDTGCVTTGVPVSAPETVTYLGVEAPTTGNFVLEWLFNVTPDLMVAWLAFAGLAMGLCLLVATGIFVMERH